MGETIRGVHLLTVGTYDGIGGSGTFTFADLLCAVQASYCPAVTGAPLKLGHDMPLGDGSPRLGSAVNLRTVGGTKLVADLTGVPSWLAGSMADCWPNRSAEVRWQHRCQLGHTHRFAVLAVALLGVEPPAVVCDPIDAARQLVADGRN